jgi:hypothetical protein
MIRIDCALWEKFAEVAHVEFSATIVMIAKALILLVKATRTSLQRNFFSYDRIVALRRLHRSVSM